MNLCTYGCGREAKYQVGKNKKWCCSKSYNSCPEMRKKNSNRNKGRKYPHTKEWNENISKARKGKKYGSHTKKSGEPQKKVENKGRFQKGHIGYGKGEKRGQQTAEHKKNISLSTTGKPKKLKKKKGPLSEKHKKNISIKLKGRKPSIQTIEGCKRWLKNGGLSYLAKSRKKWSKEELKLRPIVKEAALELFGGNIIVEHTYKVLENRYYDVDNAIAEYKIAIEFDGWYHFDTEEHIDYHKRRQEEIEEKGWKFLRYDIFHPFPTLEQVKEDIKCLVFIN